MSAFAPPPLSSHQGPSAGFVPPPLSAHEGPATTGSPSEDTQASGLQRFAQSWWDHSVLKHPIDSAVGLVKSLVTFPDYRQLSQEDRDSVDSQMEKAFHEAAYPTPELAGQVASSGTNAALISGAAAGLARGLGAAVEHGPKVVAAAKEGLKAAGPDLMTGGAKVAAGAAASELLPGGPLKYVAGAAPVYSGVRQIGRGISKGADAFKASLSDKVAAIAETSTQEAELLDGLSQSLAGKKFQSLDAPTQKYIRDLAAVPQTRPPAPNVAPPPAPAPTAPPMATNSAGSPAAQLPAAPQAFAMPPVSMEHDGSFVRSVPAEFPQKPMPGQPPPAPITPPQRLLGSGPIITPPPADGSFVRGVPAQYPAAPQAQIPAPAQIPANATPQQLGTFPAKQAADWLSKRNGVFGPYDTEAGNEFVPDKPRAQIAQPVAEPESDLKTDLRDMMREIPQGAHKSVADANYAGNQDAATAGAVYEAAARADKANKLADALHKGGIHSSEAAGMDAEHWSTLSKGLGVKAPSKASIGETLFRLQRLEAAAKTTGGIQ